MYPSVPQSAGQVQVAISPTAVTLGPAAQLQFAATVSGSSNSAVNWSASAGTISSSGMFTAPTAKDGTQITISATSVANSTGKASSVVTIQPVAVATSSLNGAVVNTSYAASLSASGGAPPYQWTISAGSLPAGIQLQATGAIAGATSLQGGYTFTAKVTDSASNSATQILTLDVSTSTAGNFDGPAELPRVYLATTLADTPAPGPTVTVAAGGDLQGALNSANCGETIALAAGSTFTGKYTVPAKSCDDGHWIIIRTSAADSSLPAEGTRMTPCYAGVASLPGRPAFACPSTQKVLATITYAGTGDGPIIFAGGANHYRLLGLEVTRVPSDGMSVVGLITPTTGDSMDKIVVDRCYIHGSATDETRRGVRLSGATNAAVQDSYISDLHCYQRGTCIDSQAVSGGVGDLPMGPYKIVDNFLEAAGENILMGGGTGTQTPTDIQISRNHFYKPLVWMAGQPGLIVGNSGGLFIVKNHLELKNAQRVLVDSNIMEDNWGGFSQNGFSILLTPKNQDANGASVCPLCQVTDVTVRYTTISHVAGGIVFANVVTPAGGVPAAGQRYSVHDVIIDDINSKTYSGHGTFAQVSTATDPLLQDVRINHVTAFPNHAMFNVGAPDTTQIPGFVFSNSIVGAGAAPIWSTGSGGSTNCAYYDVPIKTVPLCFLGYTFSPNAILSSPYPSSKWPTGNMFYDGSTIGFANYNNGDGGDYHLLNTSPAKGAGNDGLDLGANVDAVLSAIAGVQ